MTKLILRYLTVLLITSASQSFLHAQPDTLRNFIFGHSLIDHRPPAIPTPHDETTVPYWLHQLAAEAGHVYQVDAQFGFLPYHAATLPPVSQLGYDGVSGFWDSETIPFSEADVTHIMLTAANFIQAEPPYFPYYSPDSIYSPISATRDILDWVDQQEDSVLFYIYENWPEMHDSILPFPPSPTELNPYYNYTLNGFHNWWLEYQDSLLEQRPMLNVRMIPVGPILSKLFTSSILSDIPILDLYEDTAPHGRPTLYFLASLITYMSIYQEMAPLTYSVDTIIHDYVADNYNFFVNFIWDELLNFNDASGTSRVFLDDLSAVHVQLDSNVITLFPNPTSGIFVVDGLTGDFDVDILDVNGNIHQNYNSSSRIEINISSLPTGLYFIRIQKQGESDFYLEKILKQ